MYQINPVGTHSDKRQTDNDDYDYHSGQIERERRVRNGRFDRRQGRGRDGRLSEIGDGYVHHLYGKNAHVQWVGTRG